MTTRNLKITYVACLFGSYFISSQAEATRKKLGPGGLFRFAVYSLWNPCKGRGKGERGSSFSLSD